MPLWKHYLLEFNLHLSGGNLRVETLIALTIFDRDFTFFMVSLPGNRIIAEIYARQTYRTLSTHVVSVLL